jgi:hypothetical protein
MQLFLALLVVLVEVLMVLGCGNSSSKGEVGDHGTGWVRCIILQKEARVVVLGTNCLWLGGWLVW